jgi:Ca-activated chloride channel homolog
VPIEASAGRDLGGEHALIQIAKDTGGKYYYATSIAQLDQVFKQISDELRTQYLLAYYPSRRTAGDFRKIDVEIDPQTKDTPDPADLAVRHRSGYYTSKLE